MKILLSNFFACKNSCIKGRNSYFSMDLKIFCTKLIFLSGHEFVFYSVHINALDDYYIISLYLHKYQCLDQMVSSIN
jgi:hypothetical protein